MEDRKWEHRITSGLTGVILSFILLAAFGSLAIWFRVSQNDAIIISRILVIFAALAFSLALYRAIFFKVLIDKNGFFYQTAPGNGRYYNYREIRRMWISSGKEATAQQTTYCNFETSDGKTSRFFFMGINSDAVDYLMERVETATSVDTNSKIKEADNEIIISGKVQGGQRLAVVVFIFVILLLLTDSLVKQGLPLITAILPIVMAAVSIVMMVFHNLFYKIQIQKDGFYCRTNPFDGKYYKYSNITKCKLIEERKKFGSVRGSGTRETRYFYFLAFADTTNKTRKILYNKALFEREMNILLSRIEQAQR